MPPIDENGNPAPDVPSSPDPDQGSALASTAVSDTGANDILTPIVQQEADYPSSRAELTTGHSGASPQSASTSVTAPAQEDQGRTFQSQGTTLDTEPLNVETPSEQVVEPKKEVASTVETPKEAEVGQVVEQATSNPEAESRQFVGNGGTDSPEPEPPASPAAAVSTTPPATVGSRVKEFLSLALMSRKKRKEKKLAKILELAEKKAEIGNDDVEKLLRVSDRTATRYLMELTVAGKLVRKGRTSGVTYSKL